MKSVNREDLKKRTREFALRTIKVYASLPGTIEAQVLGKQLLRSGTSVGAQYHGACRGKSNADFISKIEGVLQELDETAYWQELLVESGIVEEHRLASLMAETNELIAMFVTMANGTKGKRNGIGNIIPHPSALIP